MYLIQVKYSVRMGNNPDWSFEQCFADEKLANAFIKGIKKNPALRESSVEKSKVDISTSATDCKAAIEIAMQQGYVR